MKQLIPFILVLFAAVSCKTVGAVTEDIIIDGPIRPISATIQKPQMNSCSKAPFVIICHGLTGNKDEKHLTQIADSLQAHGIASIRFNFNGHGDDSDNFVNHTISKEVKEALAVYGYVAAQKWVDKKKIAISGHSQGGVVAGITAGELGKDKICCLGLLAPAACIHTMVCNGDLFGTKVDLSETLETLAKTAHEDPSAPQGIPFWGGKTLGWDYIIDARNLDMHALAARYDGPTVIIQGGKDRDILPDSKAYCKYMPQIEYVELEGLTHGYSEDLPLASHKTCSFFVKNLK